MPRGKTTKTTKMLSVDDLRHAEYYGMQEIFDDLYARSRENIKFTDLMELVLSRENILLAYRNIKTNAGSNTAGTDHLTIKDIGGLSSEKMVEKVRFIVKNTKHGYRPKPVRRKDIPKPNGSTRPLGIPCIWDRLIQQCIKQIMEPICEAKFSNNSYGFRPQRSVEHAIAATYKYMQQSKLYYVIEFDIKGFFDNVNHSKLIRQIWAMGIQDKHLLWIIKKILKAPILMPNGQMNYPEKGTPQGGIISPLLANIVLNELDHWVESQWQFNPVVYKYSTKRKGGGEHRSGGYSAMKKTQLKEMFIIRYADDFRIFCRTKTDAEKTKIAVTQWLSERLKLEVSTEKTRVVNVKHRYSEFLGFKIKVQPKEGKQVVKSHICDKQLKRQREKLTEQAKRIAKPSPGKHESDEIRLYNSMVMGLQNYYQIATNVSLDCAFLNRTVMTILVNRLGKGKRRRLRKVGRKLTPTERKRYGSSGMLRYVAGINEPIYPIGYVQHKNPMNKMRSICCYTSAGRTEIHNNLRVNMVLLLGLMRQPLRDRSLEYADNRISLYSAQWGKCAVTGRDFTTIEEIHCHHIIPKGKGGSDKYENLTLVLEPIHKLVHATKEETISFYLQLLRLNKSQLAKLNELRKKAELPVIA